MKASKTKTGAAARRRKPDRRVLRTRDALGDALVALMREKNFVDITIQDVLDRARVSRSTFYVHYRDKNDLFLSDVEDFLELVSTHLKRNNAPAKRLLPVHEFCSHVRDMRELLAAFVKSGKIHDFEALARGFFARSIEERLETAGMKLDPQRRSAQAHALAGSFFSLIYWWIDKGMKLDPREIDKVFHEMAWEGIPK